MRDIFRIRVKTKMGEIEIEGTERFVQSKIETLPKLMNKMDAVLASKNKVVAKPGATNKSVKQAIDKTAPSTKTAANYSGKVVVPNSFNQWHGKFPKKLRQADQLLIAAYFVQHRSPDNVFKSFLANQSLGNNGITLTSLDASLNRLINEQLVLISKQAGKLTLHKVSLKGKKYLIDLIEKKKANI
jgi:hypothetical protein